MAISQTKQAQLTTPEAVYDQPPAPRPNGTNSGKNGLSPGQSLAWRLVALRSAR